MSRIIKILPAVIAGLSKQSIDFLYEPIKRKLESLGEKPGDPFDLSEVPPVVTSNARGILAFVESVCKASEGTSERLKAKCDANIAALKSMAATMDLLLGDKKPTAKAEPAKVAEEAEPGDAAQVTEATEAVETVETKVAEESADENVEAETAEPNEDKKKRRSKSSK